MKFNHVLSIFSLIASFSTTGIYSESTSDVIVLTKDTFETFSKEEKLALIEFYAPWCTHCIALEPKYKEAATELVGKAKLAKVDCTVETEICQAQGIKGFPTLKVFESGAITDYTGTREADGIVSFMTKMTEPKLSELESATKVADFLKKHAIAVVGYLKNKDSEEFKTLKAVADKMFLTTYFAFTSDVEAAKAAKVDVPSIVLHKQSDSPTTVFKDALNEDALKKFISTESLPVMGELTPENYSEYIEAGLPIAYFFYSSDDDRKLAKQTIEPLAKEYKGKLSFVYITSDHERHGAMLGCKGDFPWFVIQDGKKGTKFPYHGAITAETAKKHVSGVLDGSILSFLKSEEVPAKNDEPVKVVVGKSYDEIVLDKTKDVFFELYAPWCGHCKKLEPIWKQLGKNLADNKNIIIAKMDGTTNDLPPNVGYDVSGFPTIILVKAETNEVKSYEGDRTLDDMVKFLKENAVHGKELDENALKKQDKEEESSIERDEL